MNTVPFKPKGRSTFLELTKIRIDGGTQPRLKISHATVVEYGEAMLAGARFPPLDVFFDGTDHWLADGFHRYQCYVQFAADENAGRFFDQIGVPRDKAPCEIRQGSRRDAILHSVGVNATHGRPRNNADKRQAVLTMLLNPLVAADDKGNPWADREIARRCNVGYTLVAAVRSEMADARTGNSISYEKDGKTVTRVKGGAGAAVEAAPEAAALEDDATEHDAPEWRQTDIEEFTGPPSLPLPNGVVPAHVSAAGKVSYRLTDFANNLTLSPEQALASTHWDRNELRVALARLIPYLIAMKEILDEG